MGINPKALTKDEKDKGYFLSACYSIDSSSKFISALSFSLGSVFKRDHDPLAPSKVDKAGIEMNFGEITDSYSECYPEYV